jgi:hypothetical protein
MTQKRFITRHSGDYSNEFVHFLHNIMFGHCHMYTRHRHPYFEKKKKNYLSPTSYLLCIIQLHTPTCVMFCYMIMFVLTRPGFPNDDKYTYLIIVTEFGSR